MAAALEKPDGPYAGAVEEPKWGEADGVVDWVNEETMAGAPKPEGNVGKSGAGAYAEAAGE